MIFPTLRSNFTDRMLPYCSDNWALNSSLLDPAVFSYRLITVTAETSGQNDVLGPQHTALFPPDLPVEPSTCWSILNLPLSGK